MHISDDFVLEDEVSGLRISARPGEFLNRLHVEFIGVPVATNRDFWFAKDGAFDGTGSAFAPPPECAEADE